MVQFVGSSLTRLLQMGVHWAYALCDDIESLPVGEEFAVGAREE